MATSVATSLKEHVHDTLAHSYCIWQNAINCFMAVIPIHSKMAGGVPIESEGFQQRFKNSLNVFSTVRKEMEAAVRRGRYPDAVQLFSMEKVLVDIGPIPDPRMDGCRVIIEWLMELMDGIREHLVPLRIGDWHNL